MTPTQFRTWLKRHELTPEEAAERLGVKERAVFYWLSGERRISTTVAKLCATIDHDTYNARIKSWQPADTREHSTRQISRE